MENMLFQYNIYYYLHYKLYVPKHIFIYVFASKNLFVIFFICFSICKIKNKNIIEKIEDIGEINKIYIYFSFYLYLSIFWYVRKRIVNFSIILYSTDILYTHISIFINKNQFAICSLDSDHLKFSIFLLTILFPKIYV